MIERLQRFEIFKRVYSLNNIWGKANNIESDKDKLWFLNQIWNLRIMASSDTRYTNAYDDAKKHLIDNNDWDDEYVFLDRFKLLDCKEDEFLKFLNVLVSPDVRNNEKEINQYVSIITQILPNGYSYNEKGRKNNLPILKVIVQNEVESNDYPIGINENNIPFYVDSHPKEYPAFILDSSKWDDYGYKTTFALRYKKTSNDESLDIGKVKILSSEKLRTLNVIPKSFHILPTTFCSLGQSKEYYYTLKKTFPTIYQSILYALKDAAYFPSIEEQFESMLGFKTSLLRDLGTELILTQIKREIEKGEKINNWIFEADVDVPYADQPVHLKFDFGNLCEKHNLNRIKVLIGPNGAGKTSILKSIVEKLIRKDLFEPSGDPIFSKVIAISFSIFDTFINLRGKSILTYNYCGLHDTENTIMSEDDRVARLKESLKWINKKNNISYDRHSVFHRFIRSLKIFFSDDLIESIYDNNGFIEKTLIKLYDEMSSGEKMILNLIASLYANIRNNSLIVFDEMEIHLHPKAIRKMMDLLFTVTRQYNSACILATHSSIIVQEVMADNIIIVERDDYEVSIRQLNHESLGENLSIISNDIFGEGTISPHYHRYISDLAGVCATLEELLSHISSENLPPSLSLYMLARNEFEKTRK